MTIAAPDAAREPSSLRARGVRKSFVAAGDDAVRTLALSDVSFAVEAGELVSIIGPSGCGKSTLLRLLAGLETPDTGELLVGSEVGQGDAGLAVDED